MTVLLYNEYIELSCTNLYSQKDDLLNLPPPHPPGPPPPQFIPFLYTNLCAPKNALLNDPQHTPTMFYSFPLQYLGVSVCTVPTYCVGGEGGGAEIWLTGSGSEEVCSETWLYRRCGGGGVLTVNGKLCPMGYHILSFPLHPTPNRYFACNSQIRMQGDQKGDRLPFATA